LARFKYAKVSLPGGCAIGARPIDIHIENFKKMGAKIDLKSGYVEASTDGLVGAKIVLRFPSVGATENLLMASTLAKGTTIIENAAMEPEIDDLANYLNAMGGRISGIGSSTLNIIGVESLNPVEYMAIGDRVEAATYLICALATNSEIRVKDFNPKHLDAVLSVLENMGAKFKIGIDWIEVMKSELKGVKISTAPFPGFPTDVQAQLMALMALANGSSIITENIFENRFMHVPELRRLGAEIELNGNSAVISGDSKYFGAPVMCTDLRASAALIIAGLAAKGPTEISRIYHLERGYENIEEKLRALGAKIRRTNK